MVFQTLMLSVVKSPVHTQYNYNIHYSDRKSEIVHRTLYIVISHQATSTSYITLSEIVSVVSVKNNYLEIAHLFGLIWPDC